MINPLLPDRASFFFYSKPQIRVHALSRNSAVGRTIQTIIFILDYQSIDLDISNELELLISIFEQALIARALICLFAFVSVDPETYFPHWI